MNDRDKLIWDKIDGLILESRMHGFEIVVHSLDDKDLFLLMHKEVEKMVALACFGKRRPQLVSFGINIPKLRWASAEGFTFSQLIVDPKLNDEIFKYLELNEIAGYLK